jgi:uncharacterized protein (DUF2062 family)
MFRRRSPQSFLERTRQYIWPRNGWVRAFKYTWQRLLRLDGSAEAIAMGLAVGAFVSASPFLGLHFILSGIIAWLIGGNIIASAVGTWVGNPVTFPFIWLATYRIGHALLGTEGTHNLSQGLSFSMLIEKPMELLQPVIIPMTVGGVLVGLALAVAVYYPSRSMIRVFQNQRRKLRQRITKDELP